MVQSARAGAINAADKANHAALPASTKVEMVQGALTELRVHITQSYVNKSGLREQVGRSWTFFKYLISLAELLETVKMLRERQIDLLSLEEKIDTSSAASERIFHVFGAIAHFERRLISERTKDGIVAARAKGKRPAIPST